MTYKKYSLYFLFITIVFFHLSGCSSDYASKVPPTVDLSTPNKNEKLNEVIMLYSANSTNIIDEYRIGPEDLLEIEAYNVEDLKKTVRVNSQGEIALPLVGIIKVKGMTTSELEKEITERLDRYIQETVVTVFIKDYRSQRISVTGAVNSPQIYAVTGQRYLIDMLMTAGGLKEDAGTICYVIRPVKNSSPGSGAETIVIDLWELLVNGNFNLNIPVFAGDVINVPKGGVVFVDGAVKHPGAFTLAGKTTLVQAIVMAQGISTGAVSSDIRIFRDNGSGERDVIKVDYDSIQKGESPDIMVAENDIIIVPKSGVKNFFSGFISTLRGFITFGRGF
jgi:polysaccharide biosynthesis/export protein